MLRPHAHRHTGATAAYRAYPGCPLLAALHGHTSPASVPGWLMLSLCDAFRTYLVAIGAHLSPGFLRLDHENGRKRQAVERPLAAISNGRRHSLWVKASLTFGRHDSVDLLPADQPGLFHIARPRYQLSSVQYSRFVHRLRCQVFPHRASPDRRA